MNQYHQNHILNSHYNPQSDCISLNDSGKCIYHFTFNSENNLAFTGVNVMASQNEYQIPDSLTLPDAEIVENRSFRCALLMPGCESARNHLIFLIHGFNERSWSKYLPWADRLAELTGSGVLLFPLAFHMNRSPNEWQDPRLMTKLSRLRKKHYPGLENSSFVNAAISARLHDKPERFFRSTLQSLHDIMGIVTEIRSGKNTMLQTAIDADTHIDFFGYSIGALIAEIFLMANPGGEFENARLLAFCGGLLLNQIQINSKYLLDSAAAQTLTTYYQNPVNPKSNRGVFSKHHCENAASFTYCFNALINEHNASGFRKNRLNALKKQIKTCILKRDTIMPAHEFEHLSREIQVLDFPYKYTHSMPFPLLRPKEQPEVNRAFDHTFNLFADFLS